MPRLLVGSQGSGATLFYQAGIGAGPEKVLNNSINSARPFKTRLVMVNSSGSKGLASYETGCVLVVRRR